MARTGNLFQRNIAAVVFAACAGVLLALIFSNFFLIERSGKIADNVRHGLEKKLVQHEVNRQISVFATDQSQISHFDGSVEAFSSKIDKDYIRTEIAEWMWNDFNIQMSVVVAPDNSPLTTVFEETILPSERGQKAVDQNIDLVEKARTAYEAYLERQTVHVATAEDALDPIRSDNPIYNWSIRDFNGRLALVIAQAIIPDEEAVLPKDGARIFLTFKPVDEFLLEKIGAELELANFRLTVDEMERNEIGALALTTMADGRVVHARWYPGSPSQTIWAQTLPTLGIPLTAAAIILVLIASKFGRMVSALQDSEQKNRFLALHDALTGLPNRLNFDHELEAIIADGKQDRCAILCMDLDRFKAVNDTFGHQAGDVVLTVISERLSDRVGKTGMAARVGGDEFIILLRDNLDKDSVMHLCDQLIEDVCIPIDIPGGTAEVGASIGVAWWPDDALTVKSIIRSADEALYSSKENGRGQVSCASKLRRASDQAPVIQADNAVDQIKDEMARSA